MSLASTIVATAHAFAQPTTQLPPQSACCTPVARPAATEAAHEVFATAPLALRRGDPAPPGMVWIPGGTFSMGSTDPLARPDESPVHRVSVDGFWIDETTVTNDQFRRFVDATGYITVAERPIDWEQLKLQVPPGTPRPSDEELQPGSLVFSPPSHAVPLHDHSRWWRWVDGANWRHPEGPGSDLDGRGDHPVVHIAYEDALAYCAWAGKSLPTEAEWEFAARGGLDGAVNVWGDEPVDATRANIWHGVFPHLNTREDGYVGTAPVRSFPPNGYGLFEMAGNVWEWCSDLYRADTYARRVAVIAADGVVSAPTGPTSSADTRHPFEPELRVLRGGSFLCHDAYCASYRPSARMATSPDTGLAHTGFRCVVRPIATSEPDVAAPSGKETPR